MKEREPHSAAMLTAALEHVLYEIWKYKHSVADYRKIVETAGDAAMEFRVLHGWSLLEFLYGRPGHAGHIVASEYIGDWNVHYDRAALPWLDPYLDRCRTMLSPISTARIELGKAGLKPWNHEWPEIEPHIDRGISAFLSGLSEDHRTVCVQWIERWFRPGKPGSTELTGLASALGSAIA